MSRTKLFSFLGTGNYESCTYSFGEQEHASKFIQASLCSIFKDEIESVCVFTTNGAKGKHWGCLEEEVKKVSDNTPSNIDIPDGKSEEEIWQIFEAVYNEIEEGDNIIFDVTHSFRSIPILALSVFVFAKTIKKANTRIYYGAYEARDEEKNVAPIFDLTPLFDIIEWTKATENFLRFGRFNYAGHMIKKYGKQRGKETQGKDTDATTVRNLQERIKSFSTAILSCRGRDILEADFSDIQKTIDELKESSMSFPIKSLLDKIKEKVQGYKKDDVLNGFRAVEWCIEHELIQQGFTILQETIVTKVGYDLEGRLLLGDRERNIARDALNYVDITSRGKTFDFGRTSCDEENIRNNAPKVNGELAKIYGQITNSRNDMNHSGFNENSTNYKKLKNQLGECFKQVKKISGV